MSGIINSREYSSWKKLRDFLIFITMLPILLFALFINRERFDVDE